MRILVVDDELLVAQTLALIFTKHGFLVSIAHGADEALRVALNTLPDLVLCDIDMPGRDGVSLMEDLGRELPSCPILVLTGFYSSLQRVREASLKLTQKVSIVTKPCPPVELLRTATHMLSAGSHAA